MTDDAFDLAACGLMQTDADGRFRRVNRMFCDWVGYTHDELVGHYRFQDLLTVGGRIYHLTHLTPLLTMQGSISEIKLDVVQRDGSRIPMVVNAVRREHADGGVVHELAAFIARDRDRYEQELVLTKKRLEELLAESRDRAGFAEQMVAIVSHDLRSPLSTISMASKLLAGDPDANRDLFGAIDRSVARAVHLLSDLLDFTAARVGRGISISVVPRDLHTIVADALDALRLAHPTRTLLHIREGEGICSVDPLRVHQLLDNLVTNAVSYGDRNTPIRVTSRVDDATCSVSVSNAGTPIPADVVPTIFEPMTRGTTPGGTARSIGLGLFIVQQIAKAHGGTARVTSSADATTFTIGLPR